MSASRRRFLKLAGGTVALIPVVNLAGCSEQDGGQPAGQPEPTPTEPAGAGSTAPAGQSAPGGGTEAEAGAPNQQEAATAQAQDQGGSLPKLDPANPQAEALGYTHSAEEVDASAYPNYQAGQLCSNCNLFQPELGEDPWGGCQIFPGKLVHADGWCSAYVPIS